MTASHRSIIVRILAALYLGISLVAAASPSFAAHHPATKKGPVWASYNAKTHTAYLTIIAAYGGGFDFDGASAGKLTFTVPLHAHVSVTFYNASMAIPHSMQIVPFAATPPAAAAARPALAGAQAPNPSMGMTKTRPMFIRFNATKAGKYLIICGVPGHALGGMWDVLVVSKTAHTATAVFH